MDETCANVKAPIVESPMSEYTQLKDYWKDEQGNALPIFFCGKCQGQWPLSPGEEKEVECDWCHEHLCPDCNPKETHVCAWTDSD